MKKLIMLMLLAASWLPAADEADSKSFLEQARVPAGGASSYAMLDGIIQHRPDGGKMEEYPVYLGVLISGARSRSELLIDNREGYLIDRIASAGGKVALQVSDAGVEKGKGKTIAGRFHLKVEDLATGFLFYNYIREDASSTVRGIPCRVLVLEAPDKSETGRVYISRDYCFPLKAEFFPSPELKGEPVRTIETASFKQENGLYYAELLNLHGPGWRTRVQFTKAQVGVPDPAKPVQVFRTVK